MNLTNNIKMAIYYDKSLLKRLMAERCTYCNITDYLHINLSHPFFRSNLEYLEWKYEKSLR